MPSHTHENTSWDWTVSKNFNTGKYNISTSNDNKGNADVYYKMKEVQKDFTENTGGSRSHNNLQPYITTYMWKRTA